MKAFKWLIKLINELNFQPVYFLSKAINYVGSDNLSSFFHDNIILQFYCFFHGNQIQIQMKRKAI